MGDASRPPGGHHAGTLTALALMGLTAHPDCGCVGSPPLDDPRDDVIDALFPTAHDWQWQGDTLTVLHTEPGHAVRDVWYRRGEVLFLETRIAIER